MAKMRVKSAYPRAAQVSASQIKLSMKYNDKNQQDEGSITIGDVPARP